MVNETVSALAGRRVLVTGHTGFKGGWLCTWLSRLGAEVSGYALAPSTDPSLCEVLELRPRIRDLLADIRNYEALHAWIEETRPEVVFHMAAQPIVRRSYVEPKETYDVNVGGTVNLLEAVRRTGTARVVIVVTTDKVYENREWRWGYREIDRLGGHDPYSNSKACAELVSQSYRDCFFAEGRTHIATVRSGNVIGGGDWAEARIVPDAMRALSDGHPVPVRNARSVRPWQHVLEPLSGYLTLAERMWTHGPDYAGAWNFGPDNSSACTVGELVDLALRAWGGGEWEDRSDPRAVHEARLLNLDSQKAAEDLDWSPRYNYAEAIRTTVEWYRHYYEEAGDMLAFTLGQIENYENARRGPAAP